MIQRDIQKIVQSQAKKYPVVTLFGPRQSGKTTLAKMCFPQKPYVSLEALDTRMFAKTDPRGFLNQFSDGAILDEAQYVPELFHYLQELVDKKQRENLFILTGSQNFILSEKVSQSLAGRTSILTLFPPTYEELQQFSTSSTSLWETVWKGSYPRIFDKNIPPYEWLHDYTLSYLHKDIRQLIHISDFDQFHTFLCLLAANTGQELNLSRLGNDTGVSHNTIKKWISLLQTSFIIFSLPAWSTNIRKQLVKRSKIFFIDTGLVCYLLGIRNANQLKNHPLRGAVFETWVISEIYKNFANNLPFLQPNMFFYRENRGGEIDLLMKYNQKITLLEIKSGETIADDFFKNIKLFKKNYSKEIFYDSFLVYAGKDMYRRSDVQVVAWNSLKEIIHGFLN